MKDRGSALLTSVVIVMVLLLLSGIFFKTVIYQAKNESSEEKALRAYYLAEAGLSYGTAKVLNQPFVLTWTDPGPVAFPYGYGGLFQVQIEIDALDNTFEVTSTGYYPDINGVKRAISAQYPLPLSLPSSP